MEVDGQPPNNNKPDKVRKFIDILIYYQSTNKPKKKKKKPFLKLDIPDDNNKPIEEGAGVGEESKVGDSMQSNSSYQNIAVDKEQIDIEDDMDRFAPQVQGNTVTLKKKFAEPTGTLESNADFSMTSNSL